MRPTSGESPQDAAIRLLRAELAMNKNPYTARRRVITTPGTVFISVGPCDAKELMHPTGVPMCVHEFELKITPAK